ncbi:MAG: N-acetylmuramic acid 6-phosphate etherase [Candidatus Eremiobacteraeota bacterium]|nr:N-acetylmuramic acid 6-phosphate etherase [Candidatus Eremiobacteraeota bacterium]
MNASLPPTETNNERTVGLDRLSTPALVALLVEEQRHVADAVLARRDAIAEAVEEIAARLRSGGVLHYVGAGSSGRIATLDAAEMPPTFGTSPQLVHAHLAGGPEALLRSIEGAEDDASAGKEAMRECVRAADAVIGISASGGAGFVVAAIEFARNRDAYTVALTNVAESPLARAAHRTIVLDTGAEALAGSTRLKAGTAQKIALNAISTAVMVRLGKVHDNLMVDLVATNAKLRRRAVRLVRELAAVDERTAIDLLALANGRVKIAIVMQRRRVDASEAQALLEEHKGLLRPLL